MFVCPIYAIAKQDPNRIAIRSNDFSLTYEALNQWISKMEVAIEGLNLEPQTIVSFEATGSWKDIAFIWALLRKKCVANPIAARWPDELKQKLIAQVKSQSISIASLWKNLPNSYSNEPPQFELEQWATLVFTSGSSGPFKAAVHSLGNHYYSARGSYRNIALEENDCWLLELPLHHVSGLAIVFRSILSGASIALDRSVKEITHMSMVSVQLGRAIQSNTDLGFKPKAILLGGSAVFTPLIEQAVERGWPISMSYGLTEMTSQVTATPAQLRSDGTSGKVLKHRELMIGSDSEIFVKGETLFQGYWNGHLVTLPMNLDGWFATGDLGELDSNGNLQVLGRKDSMFISGGENIMPEAVEKALCELKMVQQALVVPVPHPEFGFRPVAFVRSKDLNADKIQSELKERLPGFMVPDNYFSWNHIETESLKPNRIKCSEIAQKLLG
jgi:o-succinylbenzoate---CoA ligase